MRWVAIILLFAACTSVRPYKKVAADARVTTEKKAIIAPFVSTHFPPVYRTVRDTIKTVDTLYNESFVYELSKIIDSLIFMQRDTVKVDNPAIRRRLDSLIRVCSRTTVRTITLRDTIFVPDPAKDMALSQFVSSVQAENVAVKKEADDCKLKSSSAGKQLRSYMFGMYGAIALALMLLILLFKR
jgi:hypothetical protein